MPPWEVASRTREEAQKGDPEGLDRDLAQHCSVPGPEGGVPPSIGSTRRSGAPLALRQGRVEMCHRRPR